MIDERPPQLPDYEDPPIHEVAFAIQFEPPADYQQAYITEVWDLFRDEFPKVQEVESRPPKFETFGLPGFQQTAFEIKSGPLHDRFWFLTEDEVELIQFQSDRLTHNWRKSKSPDEPYPRFERILPKFEEEFKNLDSYFLERFSTKAAINQCELTYINRIYISDENESISKWLNINCGDIDFEEFLVNARKVLYSSSSEPYARFHCVCRSAYDQNKEFLLQLELTVRGMPSSPDLTAASDFFKNAREVIVYSFDSLGTDYAHKKWGKK